MNKSEWHNALNPSTDDSNFIYWVYWLKLTYEMLNNYHQWISQC